MNTPTISRRQILTLAGLTIGAGVIEFAGMSDPASAAPADQIVLEPVVDDPIGVLSGDGAAAAALPRQLAVRVVRTADLPAGAKITITFDPRVYSPLTSAVLVRDGRAVAAGKTLAIDPATGLRTSTITLAESVPATGELVAVVGTANPLLYPYDLVRQPRTPSAHVRRDPRGSESERSLRARRPSSFGGAALPWGVEVTGVWSPHVWGTDGRYRYYLPVRVTLRSTGPAPTPAGTTFSISLDPRLVRGVQVASASRNHESRGDRIRSAGGGRTQSIYQTHWRVPAALAAGDVLDVYLKLATTFPAGPLTGITHPVVALVPSGGTAAQRRTGKETLTRTDSVCGDVAPG